MRTVHCASKIVSRNTCLSTQILCTMVAFSKSTFIAFKHFSDSNRNCIVCTLSNKNSNKLESNRKRKRERHRARENMHCSSFPLATNETANTLESLVLIKMQNDDRKNIFTEKTNGACLLCLSLSHPMVYWIGGCIK